MDKLDVSEMFIQVEWLSVKRFAPPVHAECLNGNLRMNLKAHLLALSPAVVKINVQLRVFEIIRLDHLQYVSHHRIA